MRSRRGRELEKGGRIRAARFIRLIGFSLLLTQTSVGQESDPEFLSKLNTMFERTETSVKILREQITQNQSAPFLPDLYLQLGDLLSQKANVLYYIQMERDQKTDTSTKMSKKFSPIVVATEEAIGIYKLLLKEFPKFDKREKVLYRLALSQKSIDEGVGFEETSQRLIRDYPNSKEAMSARLLVGQHHFEKFDYQKAIASVWPVKDTPHAYERNMARYRIGLSYLNLERFKDALEYFKMVATDDQFKEDDVPLEVSLKEKRVKSNVKREALIDSIRAYTEVFKQNADPVAYYSNVAPTEVLFQEVIEKLAFRYIFLKKYNFAVRLLRTLSERLSDPQRVMNIYQEVLLMIPLDQRLTIPVSEMQFVLEKYNHWASFFELSKEQSDLSYKFFEKQIRELGTRSHDLAKREPNRIKKAEFLERARQFYHLYLGFFGKSREAVKIAINLGDVYFLTNRFLQSGSYYLRTFEGEFGPPIAKIQLIQNAILSFQKKADYTFYEQLRIKGLLVRAIKKYMEFDRRKLRDPSLNFVLAKTSYEQGFYDQALENLLTFMKDYPKSKDLNSAGELIFEYFNIRSDFQELVKWADRILALRLPNPSFVKRVSEIKQKALLRRLDEDVKTRKGYDAFNQGKSYLETALSSSDENLRSAALEQALARSKVERDIDTFLKAAQLMANKEKDSGKRASILFSMADETLAVTRFARTFSIWQKIESDSKLSVQARRDALERAVKLAVMLKDFDQLTALSRRPLWKSVSEPTKRSVKQAILELVDSPVHVNSPLVSLFGSPTNEAEMLSLFKSQYKLSAQARTRIVGMAQSRCRDGGGKPVCRWLNASALIVQSQNFRISLAKIPAALDQVEKQAVTFNGILSLYKSLEGSGDPQLDILLSLHQSTVFAAFGQYLQKVARANPAAQQILTQKAKESLISARNWRGQCFKIIASTSILTPVNKFCRTGRPPTVQQALSWAKLLPRPQRTGELLSKEISELQKTIFVNRKDSKPFMELVEVYFNSRNYSAAAAAAVYGMTTYSEQRDDFSSMLGCSVARMGLFAEAAYHLNNGSDFGGYKRKCQGELRARAGEF